MIVLTRKNSNTTVQLPHGVSLMLYQDDKSIPDELIDINGISLMPLAYAVVKAPASYYQNKAQNIEIALSMVESVYNITRFLMNFMLVTAGFPWTILRVTERTGYMRSLDLVATDKDIKPFTGFIAREMMTSA